MKTSEIQKQLKKLNIDNHTKEAITTLIDIKTENDMREVIKEIGALKNTFESKFNVLDNRISNFKWTVGVIGIGLAIIGLIIKYG